MSARTTTTRIAAVLGILALGVGAGFAGSRLAAPNESAATPVATETIPVIAPVARGGDPVPEDSDGDENTFDVSPAIARAAVPVGDTAPEIAAAIDALGSVDDPATGYGLSVLGGEGDPCATEEASDDCPDGIRGAIFGLTGGSMSIFPVLNPPLPGDGGYSVECPASEPAIDPVTRDRMRFGVGSTAPAASMTVVYHPVGQPDAARELSGATTADARRAWEEAPFIAAGAKPLISHCFTLDELDPSLRYEVTVTAEGDAGATDTESRYFGLDHELTRPPVRIVPLLQNVVFVSVPHRGGQSVSVKALSLDDDGGPTECGDEEDGSYALRPLTEPSTVSVDIEYLERNGYQIDFAKRTGQAFFLEEGSTTMLCLFVYDTDRPSWSWDTAEYRYSVVVQPPDVTVPSVTLTDIRVHPSFHSDGHVSIRGWDRNRAYCGGRSFNFSSMEAFFGSGDYEEPICQWGHLSGGVGVRSGDVILQATIGEARNSVLLPLSALACSGVCDLPASATYQLLLPTVAVASGLCGSSFGDCTPPTSDVAAGTATFRVDWYQGFQNGQSEWAISEIGESTPETPASDLPRMNTRAALEEVNDASGFHLEFDLEVDRPTRFVASLTGDCLLDEPASRVYGTTPATTVVRFENVCHGTDYRVGVTVTDDDGNRVTFSPLSPHALWAKGKISTTPIEKRLNISFGISDPDAVHNTSLISPLEVTVNSQRLNLEIMERGKCVYGARLGDAGLIDTVQMSELVTVTVTAGIRNGNGEARSDAHPRCVDAEPDTGERMTFRVVVPLASITHSGLTITAPDGSPYAFSITLRDWP